MLSAAAATPSGPGSGESIAGAARGTGSPGAPSPDTGQSRTARGWPQRVRGAGPSPVPFSVPSGASPTRFPPTPPPRSLPGPVPALRVPSKRVAMVSRKVFWGANNPFITGIFPARCEVPHQSLSTRVVREESAEGARGKAGREEAEG